MTGDIFSGCPKSGACRARHMRKAVDFSCNFTVGVMGAIGVAGVTGAVSALSVAGTLVSRVRQRSLVTLVSQVSQVPRVSYTLHGSVVAGVLRAS